MVAAWVSKQFTYTIHKPARYHSESKRVFAEGIDYQWKADLAELMSVQNKMTVFDIFSLTYTFSQNMPGSSSLETTLVLLWYLHSKLFCQATGNQHSYKHMMEQSLRSVFSKIPER